MKFGEKQVQNRVYTSKKRAYILFKFPSGHVHMCVICFTNVWHALGIYRFSKNM